MPDYTAVLTAARAELDDDSYAVLELLLAQSVTERELTSDEVSLVAELASANTAASAADKRKKAAQAALTQALGPDLVTGTLQGITVLKREERTRHGVNTELLRQAWPEAAEKTATVTPYSYWSAK